CRRDDFALHRPLHVGDLFWPLVDEHDHQMALRVVTRDRVRDRLEHHRLAGLRRRHDQRALSLANRHHQVDDARRQYVRLGLQAEPVLRVQRGQLVELGTPARLFDIHAVDRVEPDQRVVLVASTLAAFASRSHGTGDRVASTQAVPLDLGHRDVYVVRAGQVAGRAHECVVVQHIHDPRNLHQYVVLGHLLLPAAFAAVAAAAVALAEPAAPAPPAAFVVVAVPLVVTRPLAAVVALFAVVPVAALVAAVAPVVALVALATAGVTRVARRAVAATAITTAVVTAAGLPW